MMYEVEIIHKETLKTITIETDIFKSEYSTIRLENQTKKTLSAIGIPVGTKGYVKWFDKNLYSVIVRELKGGRIICGF